MKRRQRGPDILGQDQNGSLILPGRLSHALIIDKCLQSICRPILGLAISSVLVVFYKIKKGVKEGVFEPLDGLFLVVTISGQKGWNLIG